MRIGSLFAGIGGFDLAARWMGWETVWYSEIDPYACRVMARHFPNARNVGDVKTWTPIVADASSTGLPQPELQTLQRKGWWEKRGAASKRSRASDAVDLICGGFPCQPVSVAGKRLAQSDERWLWPEFARIIRAIRPRWVVVENVPGLLARGMGDVLGDLAACGYDAWWQSLPAAAVGAPHRRDRVWIVAHTGRTARWSRDSQRCNSHRKYDSDTRRTESARGAGEPSQERDMADSSERGHRYAGQEVRAGRDAAGDGGEDVADASRDAEAGAEAAARPERQRTRMGGQSGRGTEALAHANRGRELQPQGGEPKERGRVGDGGEKSHVADADTSRWDGRSRQLGAGRWSELTNGNWWAVEPDVGRVAHGVPSRVDRLKCLGNAIVPHVAYWIFQQIERADRGT